MKAKKGADFILKIKKDNNIYLELTIQLPNKKEKPDRDKKNKNCLDLIFTDRGQKG